MAFETDVRIGFEVFHAYIIRHTASQSTANGYHSGSVSANKNGRFFFAPFRRNSIFNICIGDYVAQSIPTTIMESSQTLAGRRRYYAGVVVGAV